MNNQNLIRKNLKDAQELLKAAFDLIDIPPAKYSENDIESAICLKYNLSKEDLEGKSKKGKLEFARPIWAYLLFSHVTENKTEVARIMKRKSHSAAIDFINRANGLIDTSFKFKSDVEEIRGILKSKYSKA